MSGKFWLAATAIVAFALVSSGRADSFSFSTGNPDGLIGTLFPAQRHRVARLPRHRAVSSFWP